MNILAEWGVQCSQPDPGGRYRALPPAEAEEGGQGPERLLLATQTPQVLAGLNETPFLLLSKCEALIEEKDFKRYHSLYFRESDYMNTW